MIEKVEKIWSGESVAILAGGPSLRAEAVDFVRGKMRVIAINDSWRLAPWADAFYFADASWWKDQVLKPRRAVDGSEFFEVVARGLWYTGSGYFATHPKVRSLPFSKQLGLERDPIRLAHGSNSGYQAIGLAYHLGARRIALLGYDMRVSEGGRTHWHDEPRPDGFAAICERSFLPCFPSLAKDLAEEGVNVANATPNSALDCWPFRSIFDLTRDPAWAAPSTTTHAAEVPPPAIASAAPFPEDPGHYTSEDD